MGVLLRDARGMPKEELVFAAVFCSDTFLCAFISAFRIVHITSHFRIWSIISVLGRYKDQHGKDSVQ